MNTLLKTAQTEVKQDKNGKNYKVITLKETGLVNTPWGPLPLPESQGKETRITVYESNINGKMDVGYAEPIFNKATPQAGGYFQGSLETREVEPYTIAGDGTAANPDRQVTSATVIVLADNTNPGYHLEVAKAFRAKKHVLKTASQTPAKAGQEVDKFAQTA